MNPPKINPHTLLIRGVSQFEVDFVIPRIGVDVALGIDPFLLFKSHDPLLSALHDMVLKVFNAGVKSLQEKDRPTARYLFDFPEVSEIGLGYTAKGKRGTGVGSFLAELIIETLEDSPLLLERGVRHIEEMQLVSIGIGADRVSDITANVIKQFLVNYTQKQCELWDISLQCNVPLTHVFDPERFEWYDSYMDLPVSPIDGSPILFVPRRIIRVLPWINYDDYFRMEFSAYLRTKRARGQLKALAGLQETRRPTKDEVVAVTRTEIERVDRYIDAKEKTADKAQPTLAYLEDDAVASEVARQKALLASVTPGATDASKYQRTVLAIINYLFSPELIDGEIEVRTHEGTERRDIIFTNDSDQSFWAYLRTEHSAFLLMFEAKNSVELELAHLNQTATYLGDRLGRVGFIVTRNPASSTAQRKAFSIFNDSTPRKVILILSDQDLYEMLDMKSRGQEPMRFVQKLYRKFRQSVQ